MSITPQAIKDQEFQVKFRGYDTIEVKAYLELLAEEFFELHEMRRRQEDDFAELHEEAQALKQERETLLEEGRQREQHSEVSVRQLQQTDEIINGLRQTITALEKKVGSAEQEKALQQEAWERQETELRREIERYRSSLDDKQHAASESSGEIEKLRGQVALLEGQIVELKKEEVDFKTALVAAQRFADDVRKRAQEEADQIMAQALDEVDTFRRESEKELARLPVEIDKLKLQKVKVRDDLKAVLTSYLEQLDIGYDGTPADDDDLSELFQSIPLSDETAMEPAELEGFELKQG